MHLITLVASMLLNLAGLTPSVDPYTATSDVADRAEQQLTLVDCIVETDSLCFVDLIEGSDVVPEKAPSSATTAPRVVTITQEVEQWRRLVQAYFAEADVQRALAVIQCESKGNPGAQNPRSGASGLFQHMPDHWSDRSVKAGYQGGDIFDPTTNVAVASWLLYEGGGWSHWNASIGCWR